MSLAGNIFADFIEVQLHGLGVCLWQNKRGSGSSFRADGAEQICVFIALVGGQPWPGSLFGPDAGLAVLLPDPCFILKPDFDRRALR